MKNEKVMIDYKHKSVMKELEFIRETNNIRYNQNLSIEEKKHEWKLEEGRIWFAEQRKLQAARERANAFRR